MRNAHDRTSNETTTVRVVLVLVWIIAVLVINCVPVLVPIGSEWIGSSLVVRLTDCLLVLYYDTVPVSTGSRLPGRPLIFWCSATIKRHILPITIKQTIIYTMRLSLSVCVAATAVAFCQGFAPKTSSTRQSTAVRISPAMGPWKMMPDEPAPEVSFVFDFVCIFHSTCPNAR